MEKNDNEVLDDGGDDVQEDQTGDDDEHGFASRIMKGENEVY